MLAVTRLASRVLRSLRFGPVLALLVALAALAPGTAHAQIDPGEFSSSALGVADGQYLRLNAYFVTADDGGFPPGPCRLTLRFIDQAGATVAESVVTLAPGRATALDYRPTSLRAGQRATVRAVILADRDDRGTAPRVIESLEVIEVATGKTSVGSPGTIRGFNPQPDPPGDWGIWGMAGGQVSRLTATYVGLMSDTGFPPGPCDVALTIFNGDGTVVAARRVTVAPGETVALDLAAGALPTGVRRRLYASVTSGGRAQGFLTGSIDVFDEASGKSTALFPAAVIESPAR